MIMIDRNELHAMKTAARFDEFGNTRFPTMAKRAVESLRTALKARA